MSTVLTIEFQRSGFQRYPAELYPELANDYFNATCLPKVAWDLDRMIEGSGIRPVSEYMDDSDMLSDEEWSEVGGQPEQKWFNASDGLQMLACVAEVLKLRNSDEQIEGCCAGDILHEIRGIEAILRRAAQSGEQFRFNVG